MVKRFCLMILFITLLLPSVTSVISDYPIDTSTNFKVETNTDLCSITIAYPNSSTLVDNQSMTFNDGAGYANHTFTPDEYGMYEYYGICNETTFAGEFMITKSGETIEEGAGVIVVASLIVMLLVGGLFLGSGIWVKNFGLKVFFIGFGLTFLFMSVLFSFVLIQQVIGSFTDVIDTYSAFILILKVMIYPAILGLLIFAMWMALKLYNWRRYSSED